MFSGGKPTLHPDLVAFIRYAAGLGINVMVVANDGLLKPGKIHEMTDAGLSILIIYRRFSLLFSGLAPSALAVPCLA